MRIRPVALVVLFAAAVAVACRPAREEPPRADTAGAAAGVSGTLPAPVDTAAAGGPAKAGGAGRDTTAATRPPQR